MLATAEATSFGARTRIPHPTIRMLQATPVEATAEEAAMAAAEAIKKRAVNTCNPRRCRGHFKFIPVCITHQFEIT